MITVRLLIIRVTSKLATMRERLAMMTKIQVKMYNGMTDKNTVECIRDTLSLVIDIRHI